MQPSEKLVAHVKVVDSKGNHIKLMVYQEFIDTSTLYERDESPGLCRNVRCENRKRSWPILTTENALTDTVKYGRVRAFWLCKQRTFWVLPVVYQAVGGTLLISINQDRVGHDNRPVLFAFFHYSCGSIR